MDEAALKQSKTDRRTAKSAFTRLKKALVYAVESHRPADEVRQSFSPSAETRKLRIMAHLRGTAETCLILFFDY